MRVLLRERAGHGADRGVLSKIPKARMGTAAGGRRRDRVLARARIGVHHRADDLRRRRPERDRAAVLRRYLAAALARKRACSNALLRPRSARCRLANRIVMGSMHLGIETDGAALAAFYAERARGGAGLIVTGGSARQPRPAPAAGTTVSSTTACVEPAAALRGRGGARGRRTHRPAALSRRALRVSPPSDCSRSRRRRFASRFSPDPPRALTDDEIRETIGDFARGAFARASSASTPSR